MWSVVRLFYLFNIILRKCTYYNLYTVIFCLFHHEVMFDWISNKLDSLLFVTTDDGSWLLRKVGEVSIKPPPAGSGVVMEMTGHVNTGGPWNKSQRALVTESRAYGQMLKHRTEPSSGSRDEELTGRHDGTDVPSLSWPDGTGSLSAWMMEVEVLRLLLLLCFITFHCSAIETGKTNQDSMREDAWAA